MKNFAINLKRLRLQHNLSYADLGKIVGHDDVTIEKWEKLELSPGIEEYIAVCDYFKIGYSELFREEEDDN